MPPEITTTAASTPGAPAAASPAAPRGTSATPVAKVTPGAPAKTADVNIDGEDLGKWAKLHRDAREVRGKLTTAEARAAELEAKVAELEGLRPLADKARSIEALAKEGKLVDAVKATGVELEKAFEQWVEASEGQPGAAAAPPKELLELKAKYEALEARLKGDDDAKKKADEDGKAKAAEEWRASTAKGLAEKITATPDRWARCAKDPEDAANDAVSIAVEKAKTLGRQVTETEAAELFEKALDLAEAGRKALAEKYFVPEAPRKRPATVASIRDIIDRRAGGPARDSSPVAERKEAAVTLDGQRGSLRAASTETKGRLTESEARAKALASIRSMKRG